MRRLVKLLVKPLVKPLAVLFALTAVLPSAASAAGPTCFMDHMSADHVCPDSAQHKQQPLCIDCSACAGAVAAVLRNDAAPLDIPARARPHQSATTLLDDAPDFVDTPPPI